MRLRCVLSGAPRLIVFIVDASLFHLENKHLLAGLFERIWNGNLLLIRVQPIPVSISARNTVTE
jgi:hypothetical protein